jgi:hypothetical protein
LGENRSLNKEKLAIEHSKSLLFPMIVLALLCLVIGLCPMIVFPVLSSALLFLSSSLAPSFLIEQTSLAKGFLVLGDLTHFFAFFLLIVVGMIVLRLYLEKRRKTMIAITWDCGHHAPTSRMQYTASSFALSVIDFFYFILPSQRHFRMKQSTVHRPLEGHYHFHTVDIIENYFLRPFYKGVVNPLKKGISFQHGKIGGYIIYMVLALFALILYSWRSQ